MNLWRTVAPVRRHCLPAFAHGCRWMPYVSPRKNKPIGYVSNDWSSRPAQDAEQKSAQRFSMWSCRSSSDLWKSQALHLEEYQMSAALMDLLVTSTRNIKRNTTFLTCVIINYIYIYNYVYIDLIITCIIKGPSYPPCLVTSSKFPGLKGDVYFTGTDCRTLEKFNEPLPSQSPQKSSLKITKQPRPHLWAFSAGCASVPETWRFQQLLDSYNSYWSTGPWHGLVKLDPVRGGCNNIMQYHY